MRYISLKSKIHRATATDAHHEYEGSISIDQELMDRAGIVVYEKVLVSNCENGKRFETYVAAGERGRGDICIMGAAAHLAKIGAKVIIMAFGEYKDKELNEHQPKIVLVDENNRPQKQAPKK